MIYVIVRIVAILFFIFMIYLILKEKLNMKYSILWLAFSVVLMIFSFNINLVEFVSSKLGIYYAPATIFLFAIVFLMLYTIHLSIVVTKQDKYIVNIIQEISLLKQEVKELKIDGKSKKNSN